MAWSHACISEDCCVPLVLGHPGTEISASFLPRLNLSFQRFLFPVPIVFSFLFLPLINFSPSHFYLRLHTEYAR